MLSFAPSAAAGGQGHRMSTTWSATQHDRAFFLALGRAMCFNSFGTVPPVFTPKMVLKQDGMLAFFQASGRCRTDVLQSILVPFSLPGDPWSLPDPLQSPSGVPGRFFYGFLASREGPWDSFWTLWAPSGLSWGDLGRHFGAQSGHKGAKKNASGARCVLESILSAKREAPGPL